MTLIGLGWTLRLGRGVRSKFSATWVCQRKRSSRTTVAFRHRRPWAADADRCVNAAMIRVIGAPTGRGSMRSSDKRAVMIARVRRSLQMSAAGLLLGAAAPGAAFAQSEGCTKVSTQSLAIPGLVIDGSNMQEAGGGLPRHCIVSGEVNGRTGADGKHYAIGFEMRLPIEWNGRFLDQANGGNDGVVLPSTGDQPKALASGGVPALARGFAVMSSDSGHSGVDPANKALGLAAGAAFGLDPQARRDYGYSADTTLAPIAKAIIAAHYGRKPDYSYMFGCSNGGRHTMVAATRMPEAYDGFLVGDPGFDLPRAAIQHAWDAQAFVKADPDIRKSITADDAALVSRKIIAVCDKLDGLEDGLTANLAACQKAFDFDRLACAEGRTQTVCPRPRSRRFPKQAGVDVERPLAAA